MAWAAASRDITNSPPGSLRVRLDRFDATVFDPPQGQARIRLMIPDEGQKDRCSGWAITPAET